MYISEADLEGFSGGPGPSFAGKMMIIKGITEALLERAHLVSQCYMFNFIIYIDYIPSGIPVIIPIF